MSDSDSKRLEAVISGRVQGVGFRYFTVRSTRKLSGVLGWVRNESDGTVRLVAEGPAEELQKLLKKVQQGPSTARVQDVDLEWKEAKGEFETFEVRYH